jgi:hypothetical protein
MTSGWVVRVTSVVGTRTGVDVQHYLVAEPSVEKAIEAVRYYANAFDGRVETISELSDIVAQRLGLHPGEVRLHDD